MTILDSIIILMLVVGLWQGYRNGLMRSLVGMFGLLIALVGATALAKNFSPFFTSFTSSPVLAVVISFLAVALVIIVLLQVVLWVLQGTLKGLKLSFLDRLGGAIFGCGKNLLIILLVLSILVPFIQSRPIWQQSQIAQALLPLAPFATKLSKNLAADIQHQTSSSLEHLDKSTK